METIIFSLCILYPELLNDFFAEVHLEDVMSPMNRTIYVAMDKLHSAGNTVDGGSLVHETGANEDKQMLEHLMSVLDEASLVTVTSFHQYLAMYKEEVLKYKLAKFGEQLYRSEGMEGSLTEISQEIESRLMAILDKYTPSRKEDPYAVYLDGLAPDKLVKHLVPWGISAMNTLMLGMGPGEMHVLAARPGMGKTTLALNVALKYAQAQSEKAVCIYSLEMSAPQLVKKLVATKTGISSQLYHNGMLGPEDQALCQQAAKDLRDLGNLHLNDTMKTSITGIRSSVRKISRTQPIGLIVIDYLQLATSSVGKGSSTNDKVSAISRECKLMAYEFGCPVLVLSQLSREVERRADKRPILSDLRDSGAIEQDADAVLFLYADTYNQRMLDEDVTGNTPVKLELILAKYRHGSVGLRHVIFDRACGRFYTPAPVVPVVKEVD